MNALTSTARFRLPNGPHIEALDAMGKRWGYLERCLHVQMAQLSRCAAKNDGALPTKESTQSSSKQVLQYQPISKEAMNRLKTDFCAKYLISSRQYNALLTTLKGKHGARIEAFRREIDLVEYRLKKRQAKINKIQKRLDKHSKAVVDIKARQSVFKIPFASASAPNPSKPPTKAQLKALLDPQEVKVLKTALTRGTRVVERYRNRLVKLQLDIQRPIPRMVFGGRKLANARYQAKTAMEIGSWRKTWDMARSGQVFALGSSDETAGNQTCQVDISGWENNTISLRLKAFGDPLKGFEDPLQGFGSFGDSPTSQSAFIDIKDIHVNQHAKRVLTSYVDALKDVRDFSALKKTLRTGDKPRYAKISYRFIKTLSPTSKLSDWEVLATVDEIVPGCGDFDAIAAYFTDENSIKNSTNTASQPDQNIAFESDENIISQRDDDIVSKRDRDIISGYAPKSLVLGVDVNADHLAWCLISPDGNPLKFGRVEMHLYGASSGKRAVIMGQAVRQILDLVKVYNARLALESLDFTRKKYEMESVSYTDKHKRRNRALSAFPYAAIQSLFERGCMREGIMYKRVNPAYTSLVSRVRISPLHGVSVHQGAALAIGRRALGYKEYYKIPYGSDNQFLRSSVKERGASWSVWALIHKAIRQRDAGIWLGQKVSSLDASCDGGGGFKFKPHPLSRKAV